MASPQSGSPSEEAGPQVEWEWCSDGLSWHAYAPATSAIIESAFQSARPSVDVVLSKSSYSIAFEKLQPVQKNLATWRRRPVKREALDGMPVSWQWWESERQVWHAYKAVLAEKIEQAWKESTLSKFSGKKKAPAGYFFVIGKHAYSIEFEKDGLQRNSKTNFARGVRRKLCLGDIHLQDEAGLVSISAISGSGNGHHDSHPSSSSLSLPRMDASHMLDDILHPRVMSLAYDQSCDSQRPSQYSNDMMDLQNPQETEDCSICLSGLLEKIGAVELVKCRHSFHRDCIESWFQNRPTCPECLTAYGIITGTQPPGEMYVQYLPYRKGKFCLAGYPDTDVIKITYNFPSGIQSAEHPSPGSPYIGTVRTAYLPKNKEGDEILKLLNKAWSRRLLFRIGTSVTTGQNNVVTWAGIHHKTCMNGGSVHHGYPDETYFMRVRKELEEVGVV